MTNVRQWPELTTNGVAAPTYNLAEWITRSRQQGKRHPIGPDGRCISCGDHKFGYWKWIDDSPE